MSDGPGGTCDGCTLCCVVFKIDALGKPPFRPCRHLGAGGCTIYREPGRPEVCAGFICRYIQSNRDGTAGRERLPHPKEAGAYTFELPGANVPGAKVPGAKVMVLCVDPHRPQAWRGTRLPEFLGDALEAGFQLTIHDRGYAFAITTRDHLDEVVGQDYVRIAELMGIEPNGAGSAGLE